MSKIDWEYIREEWETSDITFKALAEKHGLKDSTVRSRKNREKWQRNDSATQRKPKSVATKKAKPKKSKKVEKEPVIENEDLTDKQRLFCIYYLKSFNQTQAAIKAGYSKDRAHVTGSELVRNSKVAAEIRRLRGKMQQDVFVDAMDVLNKYIQIAFADITDFVKFGQKADKNRVLVGFDDENEPIYELQDVYYNYVDFKNHDEIDGSILSEVRQGKDGIAVKLADKMKALEVLTKYFDLLPDAQKRKLEEEKLKMELNQMSGETDENAHELGNSYEQALNAQVEDVFADEEVDSDDET